MGALGQLRVDRDSLPLDLLSLDGLELLWAIAASGCRPRFPKYSGRSACLPNGGMHDSTRCLLFLSKSGSTGCTCRAARRIPSSKAQQLRKIYQCIDRYLRLMDRTRLL